MIDPTGITIPDLWLAANYYTIRTTD